MPDEYKVQPFVHMLVALCCPFVHFVVTLEGKLVLEAVWDVDYIEAIL